MRFAPLLLTVALLLSACGEDGATSTAAATSAPPATATLPSGPVVPTEPSQGAALIDCHALVDQYLLEAEQLFAESPTDDLVEAARVRFDALDATAVDEGCGGAYRTGICDGLDALSQQGTLIIFPLVTARCI